MEGYQKFYFMLQKIYDQKCILTSNNHHKDRKHFFVVCFWGDVSESNGCHTGHGVVESSHVHWFSWWSTLDRDYIYGLINIYTYIRAGK